MTGQMARTMLNDSPFIDAILLRPDHKRPCYLAQKTMWNSYNGNVRDFGQFQDTVFNFQRRKFSPAAVNEIVLPSVEVITPVTVVMAEIPCAKPTLHQRAAGCFRPIVVPEEDMSPRT